MNIGAVSSSLPAALPTSGAAKPANVEQAAREFESLLIAQVLKSARESGWGAQAEEDGGSEGSTMLDLSDQQFAQMLAQKGGLNLSRLIVDGLKTSERHRAQEPDSAAPAAAK